MVVYIISHDQRSKTIELDLTTDEIIWGVKYRSPGVLRKILRVYKHKLGLVKDIPISGLKFDKKPGPEPKATSLQSDNVLLGACDKDWCNYCRKGNYDKCPNR